MWRRRWSCGTSVAQTSTRAAGPPWWEMPTASFSCSTQRVRRKQSIWTPSIRHLYKGEMFPTLPVSSSHISFPHHRFVNILFDFTSQKKTKVGKKGSKVIEQIFENSPTWDKHWGRGSEAEGGLQHVPGSRHLRDVEKQGPGGDQYSQQQMNKVKMHVWIFLNTRALF